MRRAVAEGIGWSGWYSLSRQGIWRAKLHTMRPMHQFIMKKYIMLEYWGLILHRAKSLPVGWPDQTESQIRIRCLLLEHGIRTPGADDGLGVKGNRLFGSWSPLCLEVVGYKVYLASSALASTLACLSSFLLTASFII